MGGARTYTRIQLRSRTPKEQVEARYATHPTYEDFDVLLTSDCKVFAPDGSLLCCLVRGGMDAALVEDAYPALHSLRSRTTDNRPHYAGQADLKVKKLKDGSISRTLRSANVRSCVIGYFDRYARIPFCRETAFTAKETEKWDTVVPLLQQVAQLYQATVPKRYAIQRQWIDENVHSDFVIPETPFTTITVNNCVAAAYHQDKGDFKGGIGILACVRRGDFQGSHLVLPTYRLAVELQDRDVLFFDPHAWHGNVPFHDQVGEEGAPDSGGWERISLVMYARSKMEECGSALQEAERAKRHATGGSLA